MPEDHRCATGTRSCYHAGGSKISLFLGVGLIAAGLIVIFLCVPLWAWLLIAAVVLIVLGFWLVRK